MARIDAEVPRRARASSGRLYYGWWIVVVSAVCLLMSNGLGFYGFAPFLPRYVETFQDRTAVSLAATFFSISQGLSAPLVGWAGDRFGPRWLITGGAIATGLALLAISRVETIGHLYLGYAGLALALAPLGMVVVGPTLTNWFVRRRALAVGLAATCLSLAGTIFVPLDVWLIDRLGWRDALVVLAVIVWVALAPAAALVMRRRPADRGLLPDGDRPSPEVSAASRAEPSLKARRAVRTGAFWAFVCAFVLLFFCQSGLLLHQIAFMTDLGFTATQGALALSLTTGMSVVSRVLLGLVADRVSKQRLVAGCMALQAVSILLMVSFPSVIMIYGAMVTIGFTIATFGVLQPLLLADFFGTASLGAIMGVVFIFSAGITGLGPTFAGYLREVTGSYATCFFIFTGLELLAAMVVLQARRPRLTRAVAASKRLTF